MKKIAFIGQPEYFRFVYEHDMDDLYDVREFPFKFDAPANAFKELMEFDADYNIFFRGEFVTSEVLNKLKGLKIDFSSEPFPRKIDGRWEYTKDSILRYFTFRHRMKKKRFDYVFHYDASSLKLFEKDGLQMSGEFVFPVATDTVKEEKMEKEYDLFFLGRSTPHREKFFGSLKHYFNFLHIAHGIYENDVFSEYINKARINLNVHAEDEVSWEPRLQILLASGAFVISEKITPNKYLIPGEDFIEIGNPEEMFDRVRYYLDNPAEMEPIRQSAKKKIEKYFVTKRVIPKLLIDIEKGVYPKFGVRGRGLVVFRLMEITHRIRKWFKK